MTSATNPREARNLIIGTGVSGLRTAKTLLDDGFKSVHLVSASLSPGGIWSEGQRYPGLITNSGIGDYEFSTDKMVEDPDFLEKNEERINGATVGRYLENFYEKYVRERAGSVRFGQQVVSMDRVPGELTGWRLELKNVQTGEVSTEKWDKVVLCHGIAAAPNMPPCFTDLSVVNSFQGILCHSSKLTNEIHEKILALPSTAKIVVLGAGKSALDIATLYGGLGRDARLFFYGDKQLESTFIHTRIGSTLNPHQHAKTRLEWLLHRTQLGAIIVRLLTQGQVPKWLKALNIKRGSPLWFEGSQNMLYLGPSIVGGRAISSDSGFHALAAEGKIKMMNDADPIGVSSDGKSVAFKDGRTLQADVIICATGFGYPASFIPRETRKQLGLELEAPYSLTNPYEGLTEFLSLQPIPAPPRSDPANHVYKGIVPAGAMESGDLVICGQAYALKAPFISELTSHWISSFFLGSSHLKLPSSNQEAFAIAEDHAQWIRARYPLTPFPWGITTYCPWINTDQYIETLLQDMGVESERREKGRFGFGYYVANLPPSSIKNLGEERRALRVAAGEE